MGQADFWELKPPQTFQLLFSPIPYFGNGLVLGQEPSPPVSQMKSQYTIQQSSSPFLSFPIHRSAVMLVAVVRVGFSYVEK